MMTADQLRKLALALPGAHEEPHFERTSFRVGKKIFATMTADGREAMVIVKPQEKVEMLLETQPKIFFSYGGWTTRFGSVGVRLDQANARQLGALLEESWKGVSAPKKKAASPRKKSAPAKKATRRRKKSP